MSRRTERISEEVRGEIARLLREEVSDPRIRLVTLTGVDVAPDLRSALVLWSCMSPQGGATPEEQVQEVAAGLESAAAFLRRRLAAVLPLKRVPELRFRHDPSLELATDMISLLQEIRNGSSEPT
jgi:ribosome-binding factor A